MLPRRTFFLVLLIVLFGNLSACEAQPKVVIVTDEGREIVFQVEIADTPVKRERGLQFRYELASDRGMIFLFPSESPQTFWMKNTPIPLDMIFINRDHKIVGVVEEALPFSLDARSVATPSQYVLEINGGLSKRYGIKAGNMIRFDGVLQDRGTQ